MFKYFLEESSPASTSIQISSKEPPTTKRSTASSTTSTIQQSTIVTNISETPTSLTSKGFSFSNS